MSTVEASLDPKVPMWVQPEPLTVRHDADRKVDGRTSMGKFTKQLLAATDYTAETVIVDRPWHVNEVRPVEALRLVLKDEVADRLHELACEAVRRGLLHEKQWVVLTEAIVSTDTDWYMDNVTLIESRAVHYVLTEDGAVETDVNLSRPINAWTQTSFPAGDTTGLDSYSDEWYAVYNAERESRNAIDDVRSLRWAHFKVGNPVQFLVDLIGKADMQDEKKRQREEAIEALKAAHPVSPIDTYRLSKAQQYIDAGFTARGWSVDEDALDEMEYRWVTARLKKVIETVGKTTLDTDIDHLPYSWRAMSIEEAFVINVDTAAMSVLRQTTRDTGSRRSVTPDLLFRFLGTFTEVLSGR